MALESDHIKREVVLRELHFLLSNLWNVVQE